MTKRELTCIRCPIGCRLSVELDDEKVSAITGNGCIRGAEYAESECTNPVRTVTTTIMSRNNQPIPVKTANPIPKDKMFECMKIINSTIIETPVKIGDVAIKDVFGSDIIVTANSNN